MSGEPDNLVVRHLRRIDEKLDRVIDAQGRPKSPGHELGGGLSRGNGRLDGVDLRLSRIERRLDLAEGQ